MKRALLLIFACALSVSACKKEEPLPDEAAPAETASTEPAATAEAESAADEAIPVKADFEEEAAEQITADNYEAELDKLEKEIEGAGSDSP